MNAEKKQQYLQMEALKIFDKIANLSNEGVPESELEPMINQADSLVEQSVALDDEVRKFRQRRQFLLRSAIFVQIIMALAVLSILYTNA